MIIEYNKLFEFLLILKIRLPRLFFPIIVLLLTSCINKRDKSHHFVNKKINDTIFVEMYTVFGGGATTDDIMAEYLTDSLTFRKFVGTHNGKESYYYTIEGDNMYAKKKLRGNEKILSEKKYSLTKLRKEGKWD